MKTKTPVKGSTEEELKRRDEEIMERVEKTVEMFRERENPFNFILDYLWPRLPIKIFGFTILKES